MILIWTCDLETSLPDTHLRQVALSRVAPIRSAPSNNRYLTCFSTWFPPQNEWIFHWRCQVSMSSTFKLNILLRTSQGAIFKSRVLDSDSATCDCMGTKKNVIYELHYTYWIVHFYWIFLSRTSWLQNKETLWGQSVTNSRKVAVLYRMNWARCAHRLGVPLGLCVIPSKGTFAQ